MESDEILKIPSSVNSMKLFSFCFFLFVKHSNIKESWQLHYTIWALDRTFLKPDSGQRDEILWKSRGWGRRKWLLHNGVCSVFNYCWWKRHFVGRISESGISESDFLVLDCLTKSPCNPLENFAFFSPLLFPILSLSWESQRKHNTGFKGTKKSGAWA